MVASLAPSTPHIARSASARPPRPTASPRKRRATPRAPRPRTPEEFFSPDAYALVRQLFVDRAACWQADSMPPLYFYGRESEPVWGEVAQQRCSGTTLRIARLRILYESLSMDLERGLRLLTLAWTPEQTTLDGHTPGEWREALAGVFWRVGQHHREFVRRMGEARACDLLRQIMDTLWR